MSTYSGFGGMPTTGEWWQYATSQPDASTSGTGSGTGGGGGSDDSGLTKKQQSAKALLLDMLDQWGLSSLATSMWQEYLKGTPSEKIMADVRASDAYKQRFPGMDELRKKGMAISEADYISKEAADMSLMRAYGLPDHMVNNRKELGALIANGVSTTELQQRLDAYKTVVLTLPPEVRSYLQSNYGVHTGDLIGFWLNPDESLPAMQNKVAAAEVGGAAQVAGFGGLDPQQAARLAGMGVDWARALSGFQQAGQLTELTHALPGQDATGKVAKSDLADALVGADSQAVLKVQAEQQRRKATFKDSGAVATTQQGAVGLGTADQP